MNSQTAPISAQSIAATCNKDSGTIPASFQTPPYLIVVHYATELGGVLLYYAHTIVTP